MRIQFRASHDSSAITTVRVDSLSVHGSQPRYPGHMRRSVLLGCLATLACEAKPPAPTPAPPPITTTPPAPPTPAQPPPVAPPQDPWRDIDGGAEWVTFIDDESVLVARDPARAVALGHYEVATGELRASLAGPGESGPPAAFSRAAGLLAFSSVEGVVLRKWGSGDPDRILPIQNPSALAFSPSGDRLAVTRSQAGEAARTQLFATATGKPTITLTPFGKRPLAYDSGFRLVPTFLDADRLGLLLANDTPAEASLAVGPAGKAAGWSRTDLHAPEEETFAAAPHLGLALAVSPDGATVVAGNHEAYVYFHEPATQQPPKPLALPGVVTALAFAPGGAWLVAAGEADELTVVAMPARAVLAKAPAPARCVALSVSPDARHVAGACDDRVRIWQATWSTP